MRELLVGYLAFNSIVSRIEDAGNAMIGSEADKGRVVVVTNCLETDREMGFEQ